MAFIYDMTDTWNNIATTFTAIKMNVTDTNSAAASKLIDLQIAGTSIFNVDKTGIPTYRFSGQDINLAHSSAGAALAVTIGGNGVFKADTNGITLNGKYLGFNSSFSSSATTIIREDAANTLALRNSTNAQAFRVYNTESSSLTNYERIVVGFQSNLAVFGFEAAGTGTQRNVLFGSASGTGSAVRADSGGAINFYTSFSSVNPWRIDSTGHLLCPTDNTYDIGASGATRPRTGYFGTSIVSPIATLTQGTITADAPQINGSVTWNNAGVTFTAWKLNVTDSASGGSSLMYDFQKGGTSLQKMDAFGNVTFAAGTITTGTATTAWRIAYDGLTGGSTAPLAWTSGQPTGTKDLFLYRDAANTLALRNGTSAQTFNIYNTFTDASNYERLGITWASNVITFASQAAGTGTQRHLHFLVQSGSNGSFMVKNSTATSWCEIEVASGASNTTVGQFQANDQGTPFVIIGSRTNHAFRINTNDTHRWTFDTSGHFSPATTATYDIGTSSLGVRTVYTGTVQGGTNLVLTLGGGTFTLSRENVTVGALQLDNQMRPNSIGTPMISELTIATGAITVTGTYHRVDTEGDAATDDLDTINGLGISGSQIILRAENDARTVVVKDGTGNIRCAGDFSLDNTHDTITLIFDASASAWLELGRSDNTA